MGDLFPTDCYVLYFSIKQSHRLECFSCKYVLYEIGEVRDLESHLADEYVAGVIARMKVGVLDCIVRDKIGNLRVLLVCASNCEKNSAVYLIAASTSTILSGTQKDQCEPGGWDAEDEDFSDVDDPDRVEALVDQAQLNQPVPDGSAAGHRRISSVAT